ncbi:MAG: DUF167 family protein [Pseudomonadales bacterium]|nr:DUF167 family protein [Pseudomonadales bacterium]
MSGFYRWEGSDLLLSCKLQPKASQDELVGEHGAQGEQLKIRITAPPIEGKANQHLVKFLAKSFGVSKSQVMIESGELARTKLVRLRSPKKFPAKLGIETKI